MSLFFAGCYFFIPKPYSASGFSRIILPPFATRRTLLSVSFISSSISLGNWILPALSRIANSSCVSASCQSTILSVWLMRSAKSSFRIRSLLIFPSLIAATRCTFLERETSWVTMTMVIPSSLFSRWKISKI